MSSGFPTYLHLARQARETALFAILGKDGPASGLADLGAILVRGPDAAAFLHSQVTNEVRALQPGAGNFSARVTRTGALVRFFSLHRPPDAANGEMRFLLLLEREGSATLAQDFQKYLLMEDATVEEVSEQYEWLALQGPAAPKALETACPPPDGEAWHALPENGVRALSGPEVPDGSLAIARSLTGDAGFILAIPTGGRSSAALFQKVGEAARAARLVLLEGQELAGTLEVLRIEAGILRQGVDYVEGQRVLPETGQEQQSVSYTKGCYVGQEVIARIRTYGSVPNALRGLELLPPKEEPGGVERGLADLGLLPEPGAALLLESGQKIGELASRTYSPVLDAPVAFAYLGRQHRTPGTVVAIRSARGVLQARVALLPFYHAPDRKARARFLHDRSIRLFATKQDRKALELLEEALRLDPSFADAYEALGVMLGRSARYAEAIGIFKRLEEIAPDEPMVHTNLSLFYMKLGEKEKAEVEKAKAATKGFGQLVSEAEAKKQAAAEALQRVAGARRKQAMFEEVLALDPQDPVALFGLGNALLALDDLEGAERAYRKGCEVQKENSALYLALGKTLEALKREIEAVAVYRAGLEVASRKGDLMPLKEMEHRLLLVESTLKT